MKKIVGWVLLIVGALGMIGFLAHGLSYLTNSFGGASSLGFLFAGLFVSFGMKKKCPACRASVEDDATACSSCGRNLPV